ncbi:MAG: GtrA family protein [Clostridia bacterium]|nr:GtrA family protein [Clostridia bacterium]
MKSFLKKFFDKTMLKFILVGVANTLVGTAVMFLFYNLLHFDYWVSSASNYVVGSILSYFLNKYFTFKQQSKSIKEIVLFIVNITLCYLIAYSAAQPLVRFIFSGIDNTLADNLSMLAGMGFFIILNYIGQRFIVFADKNKDNNKQKES